MENDGATKREKARKILLEQFLAGKHKESGFRDVVIAENRELMPELEEEFLKLEKINAAVQGRIAVAATDARQNSTLPKRGEVEVPCGRLVFFSEASGGCSKLPTAAVCGTRGLVKSGWQGVVTEDYHAVKFLPSNARLRLKVCDVTPSR